MHFEKPMSKNVPAFPRALPKTSKSHRRGDASSEQHADQR
jgi:hypothetical protein